uniref:Capsid protein n=3 Tax=viral metagenome TaxID=1070528 RepID=A0A6M3J083_9ZZZZ
MPTYKDEDGNEVEMPTPEELQELQTAKEEKETLAKEKEEWEASKTEKEEEITALKEKLEGVSDKEFNFAEFRKAKTKEQDEMLKEFSSKEQTYIKKIADLEGKFDNYTSTQLKTVEDKILKNLAGEDEKLKQELKTKVGLFKDSATTEEGMQEQYSHAYTLIKGSKPTVNSLNQFVAPTTPSSPKDGEFAETAKGEEILKDCFPWAQDKK